MSDLIDTRKIETGLRGKEEQAEAEKRRMERVLSRFKTTLQEVEKWKAPINNKPLTLPVQQVQPEPLARKEPPAPRERVPLPDSTVGALDKLSKITLGSGFAEAGKFNDLMLDAVSKCPELATHVGKTLDPNLEQSVTVRFSETAKDCFWSKTGDKNSNPPVPDRNITLPSKGRTPDDLIDGLIFETCNAEIQPDYDALNSDLFARLRKPTQEKPPLTLCDYGMAKAKIESKAVLKDAQLLQKAQESGIELAYQSNRNLLAMLRTCKEMSGGTVENYDTLLEDKKGIVIYLSENEKELSKFLSDANTDKEIRDGILNAMASSPHNRNASPTDKNSLNSNDLYAYELLETMTAPQLVTMVFEEIKTHVANDVLKDLRPIIQKRIGSYDVSGGEAVDRSARNAVVLRIIADLKKFIPALAGAEFPTLGFSDAMSSMAAKREAALEPRLKAEIEIAEENLKALQDAKSKGAQLSEELSKLAEKVGEKTKAEIAVDTAKKRLEEYEEGKEKEKAAVTAMRELLRPGQ